MDTKSLGNKHIFGIVKVGERGQIVIPKSARDIFGIRPGDGLMVVGDEETGIALITNDAMKEMFAATAARVTAFPEGEKTDHE